MHLPSTRDRRPAIWPWLVMPLVVLGVFYILHRIGHAPVVATAPAATHTVASGDASGR